MPYIPDPTDATRPVGTDPADTADDEFRALKAYIAALASLPAGGGLLSGFRNRFINGDHRIDQANQGVAASVASGTAVHSVDMYYAQGTGAAGVFSMQQLTTGTPPVGFSHYLQIKTTTADAAPAAGSIYYVETSIEGLNVMDFELGNANAITFTLSLQMRSSITGQFSGAFRNSAGNRTYPWTVNIPVANVWTPVSVTVPGDQTGTWLRDLGVGLRCTFDIGSGANSRGPANVWAATNYLGVTGANRLISTLNATLDLAGVQLQTGTTVSPFEIRDVAIETLRCFRYFEVQRHVLSQCPFVMQATSTTAGTHPFPYFLKRTTPSISFSGSYVCLVSSGGSAGGSFATSAVGLSGCNVNITSAAGLVGGDASLIQCSSGGGGAYIVSARFV